MYLLTFLWVSLLILGLLINLCCSESELRLRKCFSLIPGLGGTCIFSSDAAGADRVVLVQVPGSKLFLVFRPLPASMYSLCLCVSHVWRLLN